MDFLLLILGLYLSWGLLRALLYILNRGKSPSSGKLPPGPRPLPLIGNLLDLGSVLHRSLAKLAKIHGPIMSLKLGCITTVVISSASMAREVLKTHDVSLSDRTVPDVLTAFHHNELSMSFIPVSPLWRNLRRICKEHLFAHKALDSNEHLRNQKLQELLALVVECSKKGSPVDIAEAGSMMALNLLANTVFSMDLADPTSESGKEFKETLGLIIMENERPNLVDFFPVLKRLDPQGARRRMTRCFGRMLDLFDRIVTKRQQEREAVRKNDMLDTLLDLAEDNDENFELFRIKHLFLDLFVGASDTSSNTLEWAMAELLRNPNKLLKAQDELQQVIGRGNPVKESDIAQLPYLQATVKETFRMHPAVPLLIPRKARATVEVGGYTIRGGAQILVNVWAIGRDPTTWKDPDEFVPERFLGLDIDVKGLNFELLLFGGGRRICPAMPLATRMVHMMLGSLINSFGWKLEDGVSPATMDMGDVFQLTLKKVQPLRVVPLPRNDPLE